MTASATSNAAFAISVLFLLGIHPLGATADLDAVTVDDHSVPVVSMVVLTEQ